jgi:hypothetical protein
VFTVAKLFATLARRRMLVLLASVVVAIVLGKLGVGNGHHYGLWDGPA